MGASGSGKTTLLNKYFYELYEHKAIGELAFRKFA